MDPRVTPTRFGILGTGRITRRLVADLQSTDTVEVTAIASRTPSRATWYAQQYGLARGVEGYQTLLDRDDIDAVYVALPPALHHHWAIAATEAGKHVLCEKPLAMSAAQTREMFDRANRNGVRMLDATAWLHHQRTTAMKAWIDDGSIGQIGHVSASVSFYRPFQSDDHRLDVSLGGGCLLDLGWYVAGCARWATGRLPDRVFATAVDESGVPLRLTVMLWFPGDVTATLSCGYDTATRKWFEVAGTEASIICDDFTRPWEQRATRCWIHDASGSVDAHTFEDHQERSMIARFIGDEDLTPFRDAAIETQTILDAMAKSTTVAAPVDLEESASDR